MGQGGALCRGLAGARKDQESDQNWPDFGLVTWLPRDQGSTVILVDGEDIPLLSALQ